MREPPLTRYDFQLLADLRTKEAEILANSGNEQGAYYLGGYAVECALKACISKQTKRYEFPPKRNYVEKVYSHELTSLMKLAGLEDRLEKDMKRRPGLAANWGVVKSWNEGSRYITSGLQGKDLHRAISGVEGVLPWIKRHW